MRTLRTLLPIALALSSLLLLPASAGASPEDVIRDCAEDGVIDGKYSESDLRRAERGLPSDIDEYTDCREAIRNKLGGAGRDRRPDGSGGSGGSGGPGGSGGGDPSLVTPSGAVAGSRDDIEALEELTRDGRRGGAPSVEVGGKPLTPGASSEALGLAGASNDLPLSLLSALVLLGLLAVSGTGLLIRRRGLPEPLTARLGGMRAPAFLRRGKRRGLFRR